MSGLTDDDVIVLGDSSDDDDIIPGPSSRTTVGPSLYGSSGNPVPVQLLTNQASMPTIKMEVEEEEPSVAQCRQQPSQTIITNVQTEGYQEASAGSDDGQPRVEEKEGDADNPAETNWLEAFTLKKEPGEVSRQLSARNYPDMSAGQELPHTSFPQVSTPQAFPASDFQQITATQSLPVHSYQSMSEPNEEPFDLKPLVCPVPQSIYMNTHLDGASGASDISVTGSQTQPSAKESSESARDSEGETSLEDAVPDSSLTSLSVKEKEKGSDPSESESEGQGDGKPEGGKDGSTETVTQGKKTSPGNQRMVCLRCHRLFASKTVYEQHMENCDLTSIEDTPTSTSPGRGYRKKGSYYQCDNCQFRSHHKETIVNHTKTHSSKPKSNNKSPPMLQKGKFKCTVCNQEMDTLRLLMSHKAIAHMAPISVGDKRKSPLKTASDKRKKSEKQMSSSNSEDSSSDSGEVCESRRCKLCPFKANSKFQADRHKRLHNNPNSCYCPICKRPFCNQYLVNAHIRRVHKSSKTEILKSNVTEASGPRKRGRPRKYGSNTNQTQPGSSGSNLPVNQCNFLKSCSRRSGVYFCRYCSYKCNHKYDIKRHMATIRHKLLFENKCFLRVGGIHKCKICSYQTEIKDNLERHLSTVKHKGLLKELYLKLKRPVEDKSVSESEADGESQKTKSSGKKCSEVSKSGSERKVVTRSKVTGNQLETDSSTSLKVRQGKDTQSPENAEKKAKPMDESFVSQGSSERSVVNSPGIKGSKAVYLESDLVQFAERPFACSLCFYRTGNLEDLRQHVQNHLTGGNYDKQEASVTTSGILDIGSQSMLRSPPTPTSEMSTTSQFPMAQRARVGNSQSAAQSPSMEHMSIQQQHHALQPSEPSAHGYMVRPAQMPFLTSQPSFVNPVPSMISAPPYSIVSTNVPHYQHLPSVNPFTSTANHMNTEDLLDLGSDFVKDPGNIEPYQCLYCRMRVRSLANVVKHFETNHLEIVNAKSVQARMRTAAALSEQAWSQGRSKDTGVKVEIID